MTTTTTWWCRRCKQVFAEHVDADWHNVATGHNYFLLTIDGDPGEAYRGRPRLIDWRRQMRCDRVAREA